MSVATLSALNPVLNTVARELQLSEAEVLQQSLISLLEQRLREVKAEIFAIAGRYQISSVEEMDGRYQEGTLEEAGTWQDFQRLDHLAYKRDHLTQLLDSLQ